MYQSVSINEFRDAFRLAGRSDQFSREGMRVLFDYLEQMEQDTGEQIELDVIALCCEWYESSAEELVKDNDADELDPEDMDAVEDWLRARTQVAGRVGDGFVYAAF